MFYMMDSNKDLLKLSTYWTFSIHSSRYAFHPLWLCFLLWANGFALSRASGEALTRSRRCRAVRLGDWFSIFFHGTRRRSTSPPKAIALLIVAPGFSYYSFPYFSRASRGSEFSMSEPFLILDDFPITNTLWRLKESFFLSGAQLS